jgi:putative ABC transport system ATP-binding protein
MIRLHALSKTYQEGGLPCHAVQALDLSLPAGHFYGVFGASGSGKSTLLNLLAGIDRASQGEIWVGDTALHTLGEAALCAWRGRQVGIVFQFFQLLPSLTALENLLLAMDFVGCIPKRERRERALGLLARLGVADQAHKFPATLSGGQQQRVAVARALANRPPLLLADEPTGNLDSHNAAALLALLAELVREQGVTVVMVSHEARARAAVDRCIDLVDGRLAEPCHA